MTRIPITRALPHESDQAHYLSRACVHCGEPYSMSGGAFVFHVFDRGEAS